MKTDKLGGIELLLAAASQPQLNRSRTTSEAASISLEIDPSAMVKQEKGESSQENVEETVVTHESEPKKKKRGRPPGLTKAKIEERKKLKEEQIKKGIVNPPKKRGRAKGRPTKKAGAKAPKDTLKLPTLKSDSSDESSSDTARAHSKHSDESTTNSSQLTTESSDDEDRQVKIKKSGESIDKVKKPQKELPKPSKPVTVEPRKTTPPKSPTKKVPPSKTIEMPSSTEKRRNSLTSPVKQRKTSFSGNSSQSPFDPRSSEKLTTKTGSKQRQTPASKAPAKEVKSVDDLKWAIKTLGKKEVLQMFQRSEKLNITGFIPGQLEEAVKSARSSADVENLARQLYGSCTFSDDGRVSIPDEINGKRGKQSALIKAAEKNVQNGGPALINALCGIGGADPNQKLEDSGNTALHVAAKNGIAGNVQNLLGYLSQVNWRNKEGHTALFLAVRRAAQMEKFFKQNRNNSTFKLEAETAYSCVEMLLHAGANICREVKAVAEQYEVADIIHLYDQIVKADVYNFLKKIMGPVSFHVHDKCLYSATIVPRDQNMVEVVLPPVENFRPDFFLTLFAVHADFQGYGQDFTKLKEMRLTGNPCLITDVVWHQPKVGDRKECCISLDGMQSIMTTGPFQPGQTHDKYTPLPSDSSQFVTILKYIPYRENKYTIMTMPGYWTSEKIFLRVYPCELTIRDESFKKGAPNILRRLNELENIHKDNERSIHRYRNSADFSEHYKGRECEILRKGMSCPKPIK